MIFIKILSFLIKFGPLWTHKNFKINVTGLVGEIELGSFGNVSRQNLEFARKLHFVDLLGFGVRFCKKSLIWMKNHNIINKNIKIVNLRILKV